MKKLISAVIVGAVFTGAAHAGFSLGMTGAFKKQAAKLDEKVSQEKADALLALIPTVPTNLAAVAVSSTQINLTWTASTDNVGVTSYKIYRDGSATPIATQTGTTYSDTGLTASTAYSYTVSACDADNNCSGQSSVVSETIPAPPIAGGEWVFVPGNSSIGTDSFYIMKYEAKNVGGVATSQADVTPWVITQINSISACSALGGGAGYHLPTIAETQTINRNIEAQSANWSNSVIGSLITGGGGLKRGNVGIIDSASYGSIAVEFGTGRDEKAKLVFSNGGEIWDWSGNVGEWIYGGNTDGTLGAPGGVTFLASSNWYEWNSTSPDLSQERVVLGPSNSSWTSLYGIGQYYNGSSASAVLRGGDYGSGASYAGVFALRATFGTNTANSGTGFRCAK